MPGLPRHRLLSQVRVTTPCTESWAEMQGDERRRFCGRCNKHVYNLSAMTAVEAEALLARKRFGLCVRYQHRSDGTLVSGACPVPKGAPSMWQRLSAASLVAAGAGCGEVSSDVPDAASGAASVAALQAQSADAGQELRKHPPIMGGMRRGGPVPDVGYPNVHALSRVIQTGYPALQRCCVRAGGMERRDKVLVRLKLRQSGTVETARVETTGSASLRSCVQAAVTRWTFPKADAPTPFDFPYLCEVRGEIETLARAPELGTALRVHGRPRGR